MPARDLYHDCVKHALIKDGWTIPHDPYPIKSGDDNAFVDLGAELPIAAEKGLVLIAVAVKSFVGESEIVDLQRAVGPFLFHRAAMSRFDPSRKLFAAVPEDAYLSVFRREIARPLLEELAIPLVVYRRGEEGFLEWHP